jgi:hypothetical protein
MAGCGCKQCREEQEYGAEQEREKIIKVLRDERQNIHDPMYGNHAEGMQDGIGISISLIQARGALVYLMKVPKELGKIEPLDQHKLAQTGQYDVAVKVNEIITAINGMRGNK